MISTSAKPTLKSSITISDRSVLIVVSYNNITATKSFKVFVNTINNE